MVSFTASEYAVRLKRTRILMAARDLAAVLVTDPANLYYLTGYDAWSFYVPQCLYLPLEGELLLFVRAMDTPGAALTAWLPPEQVIGYPESYAQRPDRHPMDWIAAELTRRGIHAAAREAAVGLEMGAHGFTARADRALHAGLPAVRLVDSGELVAWVRAVKSPAELACLRGAARITDQAMQVAVDALWPGRRHCDATAAILAAQVAGTAQFPGDYPALAPLLSPGTGTGCPHLTRSAQRFADGEAVIIELAGVHRRYLAPLVRTVMLGTPPAPLTRAARAARDGLHTVLEAIRPGTTCEEIVQAWNSATGRHGAPHEPRIGFSVGIGYPPDGSEPTLSLRPGDTTRIEQNMTLHVLTGMWVDGWGCEFSETVAVTADGAECLTQFPQELLGGAGAP